MLSPTEGNFLRLFCRQYAQLHGREDAIAQLLEMKYDQLLKAHQIRAADPRAEIHVQVRTVHVPGTCSAGPSGNVESPG